MNTNKPVIKIVEYATSKSYAKSLMKIFMDYPSMFYKEDFPVIKTRLNENSSRDYPKFVALLNDMPVGFVSCAKPWDSENIWYLSWFAVSSNMQNLGLGTRLLSVIEAIVEKSDTPHLYIDTAGSSDSIVQKTNKFYLKCGYKVVGTIPNFYSKKEDKVIYYKNFSQL